MASTNFSNGTIVQPTWLDDADTSTYSGLTSVAGTNTITATGPVSMTAYATGQKFSFVPFATNTAAVTINISGLGAKALTKAGAAPLVVTDLVVGTLAYIVYDGTNFQLINPQTTPAANLTGTVAVANGGSGVTTAAAAPWNFGRLLNTQIFTANGTYTPTAGTTVIHVEVIGGGGAGGGCVASGAGQVSVGAGGGSGGYSLGRFAVPAPTAVTIGLGGTGVAGGMGNTGGVSSLGALITANGGLGGAASGTGATVFATGGLGAATGTGGGIFAACGSPGESVISLFAAGAAVSGAGAAGPLGGAGASAVTATAAAGSSVPTGGYGGGGGGAANLNNATVSGGGAGGIGRIVIYEYA